MQFVLDGVEMQAPVTLPGPLMTDDEFLVFCSEHEDLRIESNARGEIELMPGTGPQTGARNFEIAIQFGNWTKRDKRGLPFDSSTMFVLPNGARRSPDTSWIDKTRIATVPRSQIRGLWHICPDFIIELRSASDRPKQLHEKMLEWIANGAKLGWLIDAEARIVTIYRPGQEPEVLIDPLVVRGEGPVEGFVLEMADVWIHC